LTAGCGSEDPELPDCSKLSDCETDTFCFSGYCKSTSTLQDSCGAAAQVVCDKFFDCLDSQEADQRARDCGFLDHQGCIDEVTEDCLEDGPENMPDDLGACITAADAQDCAAYQSFGLANFPSACTNFRALDTAICLK
jgi:hypothetical protein